MSTNAASSRNLTRAVRDILNVRDAHRRYAIDLLDNGRNPRENLIGEGSFGSVFQGEAIIQGQQRKVVIKIARLSKDSIASPRKMVTRLLREVLVWSSLHHRNVAAFCGLDFSESGVEQLVALDALDSDPKRELRIPGLVSLYLRYSILEYVTRHPQLREACVTDLARGLTYLHKRYVIHGDLRPDNVRVDRDGVVKLIDFGLSRLKYCSGFTTAVYNNLAPRFVAPELMCGGDAPCRPTFKSDVYSFSLCMLQILTHPFDHLSSIPFNQIQHTETLLWPYIQTICIGQERPVRERYPNVISDGWWRLMTQCWDREEERRPEIHDVFEALSGCRCATSTDECWL